MKKIAYVVGSMSNIEYYNHPLFNLASEQLQKLGFTVINPANLPLGLPYSVYMQFSITSVNACDFIYLLPKSEFSKGANFELTLADTLNKPIFSTFEAINRPLFKEQPAKHILNARQKKIDLHLQVLCDNEPN